MRVAWRISGIGLVLLLLGLLESLRVEWMVGEVLVVVGMRIRLELLRSSRCWLFLGSCLERVVERYVGCRRSKK